MKERPYIYLDNSATTRPYDAVTEAMVSVMRETYGNPSSLHAMGLAAEKAVREARRTVASALGAREDEILFTSGGTESDNTAIQGIAHARKREGRRIVTTRVEHPAVLEACRRLEQEGFTVCYLDVDSRCQPDLSQLEAFVDGETTLISVMTVNNETGAVMPIREICARKGGAVLHTDAVQAYGKMDLRQIGADLISVSGHKIHGPKGVGALYVRKGVRLPAFLVGGGQERQLRSGTENVEGIVGLGVASRIAAEDPEQRIAAMAAARARLLQGLTDQIPDIRINSPADGAPSVLNVSFLGTRGEVLLHTLEQDGIYVSTASACASNKKGRSHVLQAMGLSDREIEGAIRFSFHAHHTMEEMDYVAARVADAVARFRRLGTFR